MESYTVEYLSYLARNRQRRLAELEQLKAPAVVIANEKKLVAQALEALGAMQSVRDADVVM